MIVELAHAGGAVSPEITPDQWIYVAFPFVLYLTISFALALVGRHADLTNPFRIFFRRISTALERGTGYPGWAMAGAMSALVMLGVGAVGLYWDVAWHLNLGRDRTLMTPSHTMIVLALGGLAFASLITILFATNDEADVGFRLRGLVVPWSAVSLAALGLGGLIAFPLDALWHEAYGVDVTLWSPTHLMLVGGGALATISVWLMLAEARQWARPTWLGKTVQITVAGAVLVGLSTFQGEFDFSVPQFQLLFWPLLVVVAAGLALVTARIVLGRGGALATVVAFLILRGIFALIVGVALNHTVPRFPLYLASAMVVEVAAFTLGTDRRLRLAVVSGLGIATFGLAAEALWVWASDWATPSAALLPKLVVFAPVAAVAAAILGAGLSRGYGGERIAPAVLAAAGLALIGVLAFPLPRKVGAVDAVIRLTPVGDQATVEVTLSPPDAAENATAFGVGAWQGGGRINSELERVAPGRYVSTRPVPVTGSWKTVVALMRGDEMMSAPVYLPADPEIGAPEIAALPERQTSFVRNTDLLLREAHAGPAWPAIVGYAGFGGVLAVWIGLFALVAARVGAGPPLGSALTAAAGGPEPEVDRRDRVGPTRLSPSVR